MAEKEVSPLLFLVAWAMFSAMLYLYAHYIKLATKESRHIVILASILTGGVMAYIILYK